MSKTIAFRCDASSTIGFGHLVRCMALANELREGHDCRTVFLVRPDASTQAKLAESSQEFILLPEFNSQDDYRESLRKILIELEAKSLVVDVRDDLSSDTLRSLKQEKVKIIIIDDGSERRLAADLAFYPPVPQAKALDWAGCDGKIYCGWEWVLLRRQFASIPARYPNQVPHILIAMGGSDPSGFTLMAIAALNKVKDDFSATVIIGPGFTGKSQLKEIIADSRKNIKVLEKVEDMVSIMLRTDLALAAFGMTAYELAASGVPAFHFCLSPDHAISATTFADSGIAYSFGHNNSLQLSDVVSKIDAFLSDRNLLREMGLRSRQYIDGNGCKRISSLLINKREV